MNATTLLNARMNDEYRARMFANTILGMLDRYIPDACHREAASALLKAALDQGFELTSKSMREQYEAWQKLTLDPQFVPDPPPTLRGISGETVLVTGHK